MRQAAKKATHQFHQLRKPSKRDAGAGAPDEMAALSEPEEKPVRKPSELMPMCPQKPETKKIEQINSSRRRNQVQHLLVVGECFLAGTFFPRKAPDQCWFYFTRQHIQIRRRRGGRAQNKRHAQMVGLRGHKNTIGHRENPVESAFLPA